MIPAWVGFQPEAAVAGGVESGGPICRKVVLEGEVSGKQEWRREVGEGWVFRMAPIAGVPPAGSPAASEGYSGWDLVMDRERGGGYPDGLLLATPPYGSLNEREIGTTYGMRAQDAIAWGPRRFHFLTSVAQWTRARELYATVMADKGGAGGETATRELLTLVSGDVGNGEFEVMDARLRAGVGDPPVFARQWAANLGRVPHRLQQEEGTTGGATGLLGEVQWVRFRITLLVPGRWRLPAKLATKATKCAE